MKNLCFLMAVALTIVAAAPRETPADTKIIGAWKVVRSQYGNDPIQERSKDDDIAIKIFTKTRWSAVFYDKTNKKFGGAGGGTYTIKGDQYFETVEYFSWDAEAVGRTYTFTLKMENGMLHQKGTIEYQGNPKYIIDEWYVRVD